MKSLRVKILLVTATLVILSQVATVATVLYTAHRDVAERAIRSLESAAEIVHEATERRATQFESTVTALAGDYGFKQAAAAGDTATVESALMNHVGRAGADLALLFDTDRNVIATTLSDTLAEDQKTRIFGAPYSGKSARAVVLHESIVYEVITVPVRAPLPVAWLSIGFALTNEYARQLEDLAGQQVSFIVGAARGPRVVATSLDATLVPALEGVAAHAADPLRPLEVRLSGTEYLLLRQPFLAHDGMFSIALSRSLDEAMAPYRILQTAAVALAALPLFAALLGAVLLSRALTRPVQQLMRAAQRIQAGDYGTPVRIRSGDELNQFAVAFNSMQTEIARREERIGYQARHDAVTGQYNRRHALQLIDEKIAEVGERLALLVINLRAADDIIATLGHDIGDAYLQQAAARLRQMIDSTHLLARLDADSFLIVLPDAGTREARRLAERLVEQLGAGIELPGVNVAVHPTIGIASCPDHGRDHESLLRRATLATSVGDEQRQPIRIYRDGDEKRRVRNMTLLQDLRRAVDADELELHYQPKIAVADETVCGAEALVRWQHPEYGFLSPIEFIPIIEQSGNIGLLTHWALQTAAREYVEWRQAGFDLSIAINFSAQDLHDPNLPWRVMDVLRARDMPPSKLVIEITEEAMVRDFEHATTVLRRLRDLGIMISIDDFGTGYSSLSQLKNLPVGELKIDRSFITQLTEDAADAAIVGAAVELARKLGLEVVAEGVPSGAVLRWLRARGVQRAQGYYWSPPLPGDEFIRWAAAFSGGSTRRVRTTERITPQFS